MESNASQSQFRNKTAGVKGPVVKRKVWAGISGVGRGAMKMDKVAGEEQKKEIIQVKREMGRGRKLNNNTTVTDLELRLRIEKQSGDGSKKVETATGVVAMAKEEDRRGRKTEGGNGKMIVQKEKEEKKKKQLFKTRPKSTESGIQGQNEVKNKLTRTASKQSFSIEDYLKLLKLLKINLPNGVLNQKVIQHSADPNVIQDAQAIIKDLENFKIKFIASPRLGCREVKHALILKKRGNIQEITRIIFFENSKDSEKTLKENWEKNVSNTGHGFRIRDRYKTTPICTPTMYATAETRSWRRLEPGEDLARITDGKRVNVQELEKMEYSDESKFNQAQPNPQRFGHFSRNPNNEMECLKFFHEQKEITSKYEKLTYTKGNKVEFGFLTGNLDFLVEAKHKSTKPSTSHMEKIVIECKGTTGDMVGKLFTKPSNGSRQAQFIETHEYCYQTQAYMYILKRVMPAPTAVRAVMVVRHYHSDSSRSRDFYWNYLKEDNTKHQIDGLRIYCQEEVLARYLAVLSLIYQREAASL
ncbi:uncharacterized protein LOC103046305 [Astyanax mexicanus]|uniref:uncharacterized protein LOC103046305 n=1 Tax=Astyanax mexicanus TaxID=7994 RepID=UPI0020CB06E0|nr:uncharacterized protein LOC103046305 [Astyanax mexicanus]